MRLKITLLVIIAGIGLMASQGCDEDTKGEVPTFGIDTLSSDLESFAGTAVQGFDFSEARIRYENVMGVNEIIDFALQPQVNAMNQGIGGWLWLPAQQPAFYDMGPTPLPTITEAPENGYIPEVIISPGFSYCIITAEEHYAKIYILELDYGSRPNGEPFAWIRFNWEYQPDGSRYFN